MHRDDDTVRVIRIPEDVVASLDSIKSFQPQRSSARIAWRDVTAGSRGVTPRR